MREKLCSLKIWQLKWVLFHSASSARWWEIQNKEEGYKMKYYPTSFYSFQDSRKYVLKYKYATGMIIVIFSLSSSFFRNPASLNFYFYHQPYFAGVKIKLYATVIPLMFHEYLHLWFYFKKGTIFSRLCLFRFQSDS